MSSDLHKIGGEDSDDGGQIGGIKRMEGEFAFTPLLQVEMTSRSCLHK